MLSTSRFELITYIQKDVYKLFASLKNNKKTKPPHSQYPYLQNVISRFYICNINPLAIYISIVSVIAARAQSLKNEVKMDVKKSLGIVLF